MNKRLNTVLFILGATAFNVLAAILSFIILTIIYINLIMLHIPENGRGIGFTIILIASLAASFFIYRVALKFLLTKIDVDKYFDPLFIRRNVKKP